MVESKDQEPLFRDRLLRREAGEGWHADQPNQRLLSALVSREVLLDTMVERPDDEDLLQKYLDQVKIVRVIKDELGLDEPPITEVTDITSE